MRNYLLLLIVLEIFIAYKKQNQMINAATNEKNSLHLKSGIVNSRSELLITKDDSSNFLYSPVAYISPVKLIVQ